MANSGSANSGGLILGLLGIAFVILKLCGVIDWSWWWVTAPFWGGLALVVAVLLVALIVWSVTGAALWIIAKLRT